MESVDVIQMAFILNKGQAVLENAMISVNIVIIQLRALNVQGIEFRNLVSVNASILEY